MAKYSSANCAFFLVDGLNLLGYSTEMSDEVEALTEEGMTLGDVWPEPLPVGVKNAALTQTGWYDDATNATNQAFSGATSTNRVVCLGYEGNTIGEAMTGFAGTYASKYTRIATRNQLHKATAAYRISGASDTGVILHTLTQEAGDGNTEGASSVDNTASTAAGAVGYLQVSAITLSGRPNVVMKIRHSADDVTYADLITFTAIAAIGAERATAAGTINRHLATSWAWGGAGGSPVVTFTIGCARG